MVYTPYLQALLGQRISRVEAPVGVTVDKNVATTAGGSVEVLAIQQTRQVAVITNDSDTVIYLTFGRAATASVGVPLYSHDSYVIEPNTLGYIWTGSVNAYCASASKNIAIHEES